MALKDDASEIRAYMQGRASQLNLDNTKKRWPKWVFRSDHIENVAAILEYGKLLSRARAESEKLIFHDIASPEHIAELSTCQGRYVRLYFRPRTPTQYANEGIRPSSKIQYGAHMPVPVYLLFSAELLEEEEIQFTRGRLRSDTEIGDGASFLR